MSSPIKTNVDQFLYSPAASPSGPSVAASSLPGAIKTPSPHTTRLRTAHLSKRFSPMGTPVSPSAAARSALRQLNLGNSDETSPETAAASSRLKLMHSKRANRLRKIGRAMQNALQQAAQQYEDSAKDGWIAASRKCPVLHPERADTRVYPEDSQQLAKKAQAIADIQRAQDTGLTCMPHQLPFFSMMPDMPLPDSLLNTYDAYGEATGYTPHTYPGQEEKEAELLRQVLNQELHYVAFVPASPHKRVVSTTQLMQNL